MVPADDHAMALPWASVIVIMVLLNLAFTCATPEAMFLRSRRRTRVASLPIHDPFAAQSNWPLQCCCADLISSCRQSPGRVPCGCGHWYEFAVLGRANLAGDATHDSSPGP